ncbi:MAG: phenylalanine--tRNA ligase subunit beta, partial [Longimicrobiales bacterium]
MDVSYRWIEALAPGLDADPEEVSRRLAARGAPVEEITELGQGLEGIRVARVRAIREHPNADRLVLCEVESGEGEEVVQVVCGAPNVEAGGLFPFAPVGASLPNGLEIGEVKIRGETSRGMLCSESELGLGPGHEGLLELPPGVEVGASLASSLELDDVRLDVEVTPNRGDLLSHVGVAREVAPGGEADICIPDIPGAPEVDLEWARGPEEVSEAGATIRIDAPDLCWRYLGAVIRGVEVGPSPDWLRARLRAAGARPVNNVVDATNYVLLEMGQPLHAFDLARLDDDTVVVRRAAVGEVIRTLDGTERDLTPEMLCICDATEPVAVAGVMGGEGSEVGEETTDILLECALFEPAQVRATRMALGMSTDASYRFERGVDPEGMERALRRAVELILATAGGELGGPVLDVHPRPGDPVIVSLRLERIGTLLGIPFSEERVRDLLEPLGFELDAAGGRGEGAEQGSVLR